MIVGCPKFLDFTINWSAFYSVFTLSSVRVDDSQYVLRIDDNILENKVPQARSHLPQIAERIFQYLFIFFILSDEFETIVRQQYFL